MKNLILIPALSVGLMADGYIKTSEMTFENNTTQSIDTLNAQERTWYEVAMFKPETPLTEEELKNRVIYTNLIGAGVVTVWGITFWDYFTTKPIANNEGWFGKGTKHGGADKLGHLYSTYLWSLGFSSLYEYWGMSDDDALLYGPLTSWFFHGFMELGDSFSDTQGFSYEDMVMNTLGAGFYYLREKYPEVKRKVDLRLEYIPDFNTDIDFFTQYNSMKYLMALKFSGFDNMKDTTMKYFELQLGYYSRGYSDHKNYAEKERVTYVGIGINVSEVLKDIGWKKTSKVFNYYQLPYTNVPFEYDADSHSYVSPYSRPYFGTKK